MTTDPYVELGVERGATDSEKNPRLDPASSFYAPAAVPWRTWSPDEQVTTMTLPKCKPRRGVAVLGLSALLVVIAAVNVHAMRHRAASVTTDGPSVTTQAFGGSPPVTRTSHPQRLLPPVTPPAGSGGYTFEAPARFDPCRSIRYVISGAEPFAGANDMLTQALGEASAASGLQFVYAGTTTEQAQNDRPSYQPARYGKAWAPVLVAWTDQSTVTRLAGQVIGLGGAASASVRGHQQLVSGVLYFDAPELALIAQSATGYAAMRTVMLHEIGHLLGLGHVGDPTAVMYPSDGAQGDYNDGDLRGLAYAGSASCSNYS